jgi:alcohol dehydrogenase class IV
LLASGLSVNFGAVTRGLGNVERFHKVNEWLADGLGNSGEDGVLALRSFVDANGLPSLRDLGVLNAEIEEIAELALSASSTKANPVKIQFEEICYLLRSA